MTAGGQHEHSGPAVAGPDCAGPDCAGPGCAGPGSNPDAALRALYEKHGSALLSYLMRLAKGDRHRAEDLLQETLVRAWRHPEARVRGEWSRPWLFMVARRIFIDHVRATQARPAEVGEERLDERPDADNTIEQVGEHGQILDAVLDLPPRFRDVLVEIYFRDRSVAQAAEIIGVPEGTIKSRTFYALRALRERFAERSLLDGDDA